MNLNKNKEVVAKIKEIRLNKNISQLKIAQALNLNVTAYNRIENNKTQLTINNLFIICDTLEICVESILNFNVGKNIHNHQNLVMSNFNNGTLHISISAEDLSNLSEKTAKKTNLSKK